VVKREFLVHTEKKKNLALSVERRPGRKKLGTCLGNEIFWLEAAVWSKPAPDGTTRCAADLACGKTRRGHRRRKGEGKLYYVLLKKDARSVGGERLGTINLGRGGGESKTRFNTVEMGSREPILLRSKKTQQIRKRGLNRGRWDSKEKNVRVNGPV